MKVKIPEEEICVPKLLTVLQYRGYSRYGRKNADDEPLAYESEPIIGLPNTSHFLVYSDGTKCFYAGSRLVYVRLGNGYMAYTNYHKDCLYSDAVTVACGKNEKEREADIASGISAVIEDC
jgi:hypothetical protein